MHCLETIQLTHRYRGATPVLHDLCLQVPEHSIYGFLGPNGAGKTTTMRLLAGLTRLQQGEVRLLGLPLHRHRVTLLKQLGVLIESPSFYGHLSARENLRLLQRIYQCPASRIDHVLEWTGLEGTGAKTVGRFSLGMKQRFAIAAALLNEPVLLILDEPTNGLDPNGMAEVRELLIRLNREYGTSIFLSSHLLGEIAKLATHVGIIHHGKLLFQGTLEALGQAGQRQVELRTGDSYGTLQVLTAMQLTARAEDGRVLLEPVPDHTIAAITRALVHERIEVYGITAQGHDLEQIFLQFIKE